MLQINTLSVSDAPSLQKVISVREIADTMISIPYPYPDGETQRYISQKISEFESSHSVTFVIERKLEKFFCGAIEIGEIEDVVFLTI